MSYLVNKVIKLTKLSKTFQANLGDLMLGEIPILPKWSAHSIINFEELLKINKSGDKILNFASCALINLMPIVGVTELTEKTKMDLWKRISIFQAIYGTSFYFEKKDEKIPVFLTQEDIYRHLGITTEGKNTTFVEFCDWMASVTTEVENSSAWCANHCKSLLQIALN